MRVVIASYPLARACAQATGGAEQIAWHLFRELRKMGAEAHLLTPDALPPRMDVRAQREAQEKWRRRLAAMQADILHLHGLDYAAYAPVRPGVIITLHMPSEMHEALIHRPEWQFVCVSESQRALLPPAFRKMPIIENGIAFQNISQMRKRNFALMLTRICPEKGIHLAAEACRLARMPLFVAGETYPYHAHLDYAASLSVKLRGPRTGSRKARLLAAARCLIVASTVPETSSLAAREALGTGTPVIAFRQGALTEIIRDGVNGFLVSSVEGMALAIRQSTELSPAPAVSRTAADMARAYLDLYRRVKCAAS